MSQSINDAILEAEAWKETASRWRKRALREGGSWRRKCRELEEQVDRLNERGVELVEERDSLKVELLEATKNRLSESASRDLLQRNEDLRREADKNVRLLTVLREEQNKAAKAEARARDAELASRESNETMIRVTNEAKAALQVVGLRLGVDWHDPRFGASHHELAAEIDKRILALLSKVGPSITNG